MEEDRGAQRDEKTPSEAMFSNKGGPSLLVTQHGLFVSISQTAKDKYMHRKCTTKAIAFKPAIEFYIPNTAAEDVMRHSRCFTAKKRKRRGPHP